MGQPRPLFRLFSVFSTNNTIFTTNQCEKMSCPSSIRRRDSNPRPLDHESPPITTRSGLPPNMAIYLTLCNLFKPLATFLPKLPTFLGNFCKGVKIPLINFSSEIIFWATFRHLAIFSGHTAPILS